jgi:hypothetical protein
MTNASRHDTSRFNRVQLRVNPLLQAHPRLHGVLLDLGGLCCVITRAYTLTCVSRLLGRSAVFADLIAEDLPALDPGGDIDGMPELG